MAVLELEQQVQVLEEETEKMVQRMVQMEERLSADVLCLNVGVSQIGTAVRAVGYALFACACACVAEHLGLKEKGVDMVLSNR